MEYSFTNVWGQGWNLWKKSWLMLMCGVLIIAAAYIPAWLVMGVQNILGAAQLANKDSQALAVATGGVGLLGGCFSFLYSIFVLLPLVYGLLWMGVRAARGQVPQLSDILRGYRRFPTILGTIVLFYIVALIPLILAAAVLGAIAVFGIGIDQLKDGIQESDFDAVSRLALALGGLWAVICYVVLVWISIRLYFSLVIAIDDSIPSRGPLACIETSWRITRGKALSLFGLIFTIGLMFAVTILCCVLPSIVFGYPLGITMFGLAYDMLLRSDAKTNQTTLTAA